ncbi:MAG TPA: T9SS type A sorting domain-containing protein, partial [Cryomorphaceae bacterium]|nr:T9SS type A sorting domain-containing protein [Cryomorphaceae bacterium]
HPGSSAAGAYVNLVTNLNFDAYPIICMNIFTDAPIGTSVTLRIEDTDTGQPDINAVALTTVSGEWEPLCFVYQLAPDAYDRLTFLFDLGNIGDGSSTSTFLFDEVEQLITPADFFYTIGSAYFCPGFPVTFNIPGASVNSEWYSNQALTNLVGIGNPFTTPSPLFANTSYWVQDNSSTFLGEDLYGPSEAILGGPTGTPNTVSTFFTSNMNGEFRSVKMRQRVIGAPTLCNYTVTAFNLTAADSRSLNWSTAPPTDGAVYTYNFPTALPITFGDEVELEITSFTPGCHVQASNSGDNVNFLPFAVNGSNDPQITFTGHTTEGVADQLMSGMDYRIFGDYVTSVLYQVNAIADCANPLPIELLDFFVSDNKGDALLQWSTASEQNNDRFELLRTIDGIHFETVGTVGGAGNSSTELHYSFRDRNPLSGQSYYLLKQIDFDGKESDSELVAFTNEGTGGFQLFPNPTSQDLTLMLSEGYDKIEIRVYDLSGRLINQHNFGATDNLSFELTGNPGTYFVEVLVDEQRRETFNVMKL